MINADEVFQIGYIAKGRGISGEVELRFTDDVFDRGDAEYLILQIDGIFVPFFWEEYRFKSNEVAIFKFEHVDDECRARSLVGTKVFYPLSHVPDDDEPALSSLKVLTGYAVYVDGDTRLGSITDVDDRSANVLLTITAADGRSWLVPFHTDFVTAFDHHGRSLHLSLPDGLLELSQES